MNLILTIDDMRLWLIRKHCARVNHHPKFPVYLIKSHKVIKLSATHTSAQGILIYHQIKEYMRLCTLICQMFGDINVIKSLKEI